MSARIRLRRERWNRRLCRCRTPANSAATRRTGRGEESRVHCRTSTATGPPFRTSEAVAERKQTPVNTWPSDCYALLHPIINLLYIVVATKCTKVVIQNLLKQHRNQLGTICGRWKGATFMGAEDDFVFVNEDTLDKRSGKIPSLFFFEFRFSGYLRPGKGGLVEKYCFPG